MLYLINFTDPNDRDIQMDIIIDTPLGREVVIQTIEKILEEAKEKWSKNLYSTLDEILAEGINKEFKILDYEFISFPW